MLPIKTILHPTDFSERSDYAFRLACMLARDHGSRIVVLHVATPFLMHGAQGVYMPGPELDEDALRASLTKIRPDSSDVSVEHRLVVASDPSGEILHVAQQIKCDLIVLGTHGRSGVTRALLGSVAEQVLRKSECPVLTVKKPSVASEPSASDRALAAT